MNVTAGTNIIYNNDNKGCTIYIRSIIYWEIDIIIIIIQLIMRLKLINKTINYIAFIDLPASTHSNSSWQYAPLKKTKSGCFLVSEKGNTVAICNTCPARVQSGGNTSMSFNTTNFIAAMEY